MIALGVPGLDPEIMAAASASTLADLMARWFRAQETNAWLRAGADLDKLCAQLAGHIVEEVA